MNLKFSLCFIMEKPVYSILNFTLRVAEIFANVFPLKSRIK